MRTLNEIRRKCACSNDTINEIDVLVDVLHDVVVESKSGINFDTLMAAEQKVEQIAAGID
jgi:hypothetical protein